MTNSPGRTERGNSSHCSPTSGFQNKMLYLPLSSFDWHTLPGMADSNGPGAGPRGHLHALLQRFSEHVFQMGEDFPMLATEPPCWDPAPVLWKTSKEGSHPSPAHTIYLRTFFQGLFHTPSAMETDRDHLTSESWQLRENLFLTLSLLRNQWLDHLPNLNLEY